MREWEGQVAPPDAAPTLPQASAAPQAHLLQLQRVAGNRAVIAMLGRLNASGAPAPPGVRRDVEAASGVDLSAARVHRASHLPSLLGAEAFAYGNDVHLAPGKDAHLNHELAHVAQQQQGRVRRRGWLRGLAVNRDEELEAEADQGGGSAPRADLAHPTPVVQGVFLRADEEMDVWRDEDSGVLYRVVARGDTWLELEEISSASSMVVRVQLVDDSKAVWPNEAPGGDDGDDNGPGAEYDGQRGNWNEDRQDRRRFRGAKTGVDIGIKGTTRGDRKRTSTDLNIEDGVRGREERRRAALGEARSRYDEDDEPSFGASEPEPSLGSSWNEDRERRRRIRGAKTGVDIGIKDTKRGDRKRTSTDLNIEDGVRGREERRRAALGEARSRYDEDDEPSFGASERETFDDADPEDWWADEEDEDFAELCDLLSDLRISFKTALDENGERHHVGVDPGAAGPEQAVFVESNPVPLDTILSTGFWLQKLDAKVLATLAVQGAKAQAALVAYGLARSKAKSVELKNALRTIAGTLANATSLAGLPATDLTASANFGKDSGNVEGSHVQAKMLSLNAGTTGSSPNGDGRLMKAIRIRAGVEAKSYKQMHLLNDNVFGPGELWNLTPGPAKSNSDMEHRIEDPLKRAVIDKGLVIDFEAEVNYKNDPMSAQWTDISQNPDDYRFHSIKFSARQYEYDHSSKTWKFAAKPEPEITEINGKSVTWNWGGLTPLGHKAAITETDPAKLVASGVPDDFAQRIANFNLYNGGKYMLASGETTMKKEKLKELIYRYEKDVLMKPKVVFGAAWDNGWSANQVLWK